MLNTLHTSQFETLILPQKNITEKDYIAKKNHSLNAQLLSRQKECLYYIAQGVTVKFIAKKLDLSPRTIETYVNQLKDKLCCESKIQIATKAIELGLINLDFNRG